MLSTCAFLCTAVQRKLMPERQRLQLHWLAAEQAMTDYPMTDLMSTVKFVEPGMTLLAPGHTEMAPTVHTRLGSRLGLILGSTLGSIANCAAPLPSSKACSVSPSRPPLQCCSMVYMASAAAAKGSRLIAIGTVPACPCGGMQCKLAQELNCLSRATCIWPSLRL